LKDKLLYRKLKTLTKDYCVGGPLGLKPKKMGLEQSLEGAEKEKYPRATLSFSFPV
jgi:hypothetical protein